MAKKTDVETFEQVYARLEETVAKLEEGGLSLDQSIALYEEGMELARRCQAHLDEAEQKVTKLRETFAPVPERGGNGRVLNDELSDYEYVPVDEEASEGEADPFE
jgi:exodeoxyribonuclease VII small subunit